RVRPADPDGVVAVTTVLVNRNLRLSNELGDGLAYFQPSIQVSAGSDEGQRAIFAARGYHGRMANDEDLEAYRLLYRHIHEFGVGHGCSVNWVGAPGDSERAIQVMTTFTPSYEVPLFGSNPSIQSRGLAIGEL